MLPEADRHPVGAEGAGSPSSALLWKGSVMAREVRFILYDYDHLGCTSTLQSIFANDEASDWDTRVVYIPVDKTEPEEEFADLLEQYADRITTIPWPGEESQARAGIFFQALSGAADDTMVCFTRSGIHYGYGWIPYLDREYASHGEGVYFFHIRGGSQAAFERAVNAYRKQGAEPWSLEDHYALPCLCYPCYFIPAGVIRRSLTEEGFREEKRPVSPFIASPCTDHTVGRSREIFAIWYLILTACVSCGRAWPLHKRLRFGARAVEANMWKQLCQSKEDIGWFFEVYLENLLALSGRHPSLRRYMDYNILYLIRNFMLSARLGKDGERNEGTAFAREAENVIRRLSDDHALIWHNGYIRPYKQYILHRSLLIPSKDPESTAERERLLDPETNPSTIYFMLIKEDVLSVLWGVAQWKSDIHARGLAVGDVEVRAEKMKRVSETFWFDQRVMIQETFLASLPIPKDCRFPARVEFWFDTEEGRKRTRVNDFGYFAPLARGRYLYYEKDGWTLSYEPKKDEIHLERSTRMGNAVKWLRRTWSMWNNYGRRAILVRILAAAAGKLHKDRIWLVSDRANLADDNGEAFFRFLAEHPVPGVTPYFVLQKKSPDYPRLKKLGKVIEPLSLRHKIYHLLSEYIISSQGNFVVVKPFKKYAPFYKDITCGQRFVILQHGVTKDDQSKWLNRYNLNIRGLVAATNAEYASFLSGDYYYREKEVWLTGFPRYDLLYHDEKHWITIMPTWRESLSSGKGSAGEWLIDENFVQSGFFTFYNELLNHPVLRETAREYGYTICFKAHPNILPVLSMFDKPDEVLFFDQDKPYREIFACSDLIVTDYSSVAFDFAYLRKPVVYAQFDADEFFDGGHSYVKGYFDYERDGFGEVTHDIEETVRVLAEYMKTECRLKPMYLDRINRTFAFRDQGSCQRVLDRILEDREADAGTENASPAACP